MSTNIVVPELGESVVEARVAKWLKKQGDSVNAGEPLVELETEKIDLEVSADRAGVLASIKHQEGADVKVGEVLAVLEESTNGAGKVPMVPVVPEVQVAKSAENAKGADKKATPTAKNVARSPRRGSRLSGVDRRPSHEGCAEGCGMGASAARQPASP
jgi:2-oxoglutarate dehydrogenase E2 component (dihydrolipoamide succinyltransferase)